MSITYDYIDDYLYRIAPPRDTLLERMEEYAETNSVPIIGPLVGRLLYNLAKISQSRKVLEIGTAIGYSGIWLARAVAPLKGSLTTIDMNPERVKIAITILLIIVVLQFTGPHQLSPVGDKYTSQPIYTNRGTWIILENMSYGRAT